MHRLAHYWLSRPLSLGLLLAALTLRAIVPAGYMPSAERPFGLQWCQVGLTAAAAPLDHQDNHADSSGQAQPHHGAQSSTCWFGGAPSVGFVPTAAPAVAAIAEISTLDVSDDVPAAETRRFRVVQPRAPPSLS